MCCKAYNNKLDESRRVRADQPIRPQVEEITLATLRAKLSFKCSYECSHLPCSRSGPVLVW